jgi:hypothetical protein
LLSSLLQPFITAKPVFRSVLFSSLVSVDGDHLEEEEEEGEEEPKQPPLSPAADRRAPSASKPPLPPLALALGSPQRPSGNGSLGVGAGGAAQRPSGNGSIMSVGGRRRGSAIGARVSYASSLNGAMTSRGLARIRELSGTMRGGEPTSQTLESVRSINKTVERSMNNVGRRPGRGRGPGVESSAARPATRGVWGRVRARPLLRPDLFGHPLVF